ncbi:Monooxygenase aurF, partial [Apiospora phragmitis]
YTKKELQEALDCIANGTPIKQAAREYGIPESTLRSRLQGHQSRSEGAVDLQRLSPDQEKHLASWIIAQQALGLPLTHAQITDKTAVEWLEKAFIPNTAPENPSEYRLLIVDGYGSYTITNFITFGLEYPKWLEGSRLLAVGNTFYTTSDPAYTEPNGFNKVFYTPRNIIRSSDIIYSTLKKSVKFKEQVRLINLLEKNIVI